MPITINGSTGVAGIDGSAGTPSVQGADTNTGVFFPAADAVSLSTGGTERLRVDSTGRVVISTTGVARANFLNTSLASASFQVEGNGATSSHASVVRNSANANGPRLMFGKSRGSDVGSNVLVQSGDNLGSVVFQGNDGSEFVEAATISAAAEGTTGADFVPGYLAFSTSSGALLSERMRIDSSGNVGIGVAPSYKLDVNSGAMRLASGSTGYALFQYGASGTASNNWHSGSEGNGDFRWYNGTFGAGTMRMNLSSAGDLQVGAGNGASIATVSAITSSVGYVAINHPTGTANGNWYAGFNLGGTTIGTITQATGSSVNYNTTSDYRLKDNVTPLSDASSRVLALKPIRYSFKAEPDQMLDGFLAHEAQEVVPEAVVGTKDAVDDNGNPLYQGIDQSKLVPLLTAALQEALKKIDALEARIVTLETFR